MLKYIKNARWDTTSVSMALIAVSYWTVVLLAGLERAVKALSH